MKNIVNATRRQPLNECQASIMAKWLRNVSLPQMLVNYKAMVFEHIKNLPDPENFTEGDYDDIFYTQKMLEELNDLENR
uniref:hypothetical protein n=1 Tax=Roseivirga sp. TaxID=1964215 RepID=UPI00404879CF